MQGEICRLPVPMTLLKSQNRWHFSDETNLVRFFCLIFLLFLTFMVKCSAILRVKQRSQELMGTNAVCLIFTSCFLSPFQDFWWPSLIIATWADYQDSINWFLNTHNNTQNLSLFHMFGGKQTKLSCVLILPVRSNPRKASDCSIPCRRGFLSRLTRRRWSILFAPGAAC